MRAFSLYVHVPFCSQKCPYCDFNTYAVKHVPEEEYVDALCRELDLYKEYEAFNGSPIQTIFFGGGTPSLFSPKSIGRVIQHAVARFPIISGAEISLEANPFLVDEARLSGYRTAGVNRLSFGAQSFNVKHLRLLGREHVSSDIERAVTDAAAAGYENISLDILFGLPGQTVDELVADLDAATRLPIQHLSTYSLTIEPGTPFFQRQERRLFSLPSDDIVREMLDLIPNFFASRSFERYEISNYAKHGFESKHNCAYWNSDNYLGVGAGAHSFLTECEGPRRIRGNRWSNCAPFEEYMRRAGAYDAVSWRESLDVNALMFEFFYLGLRRMKGVSLREFEATFGPDSCERYVGLISELETQGMIVAQGEIVRLTSNGIALADSVFEHFVIES